MSEQPKTEKPHLFSPSRKQIVRTSESEIIEVETTTLPPVVETIPKHHREPKTLFSWSAAERMWKPKNKVWYLTSALVILIAIMVAAKLEYYIMIVALVAFLLLWFVQGTLEPWIITHSILTEGVFSHEELYEWKVIRHFWFGRKKDQIMLYIDFTDEAKEPRLTLLVNPGDDIKLFKILLPKSTYASADAAEYNILSRMLYGEYLPISHYLNDLDKSKRDNGGRMVIEGK